MSEVVVLIGVGSIGQGILGVSAGLDTTTSPPCAFQGCQGVGLGLRGMDSSRLAQIARPVPV
jgi:hypothetical protein